ncbi:methyl-accepting chemotaxis protein [Pararobbsia alpina]|uniref:methyl-accepting chemotaxis protein n=1 Tax=Pararobbsia alpina TaxID=621374 RepID=UPI0039A4C8C5
MKKLFARLTLPTKFLLLGVLALALIAWPTALFVFGSNATVASKHHERAGLPTLHAMIQLLEDVQQHRAAMTRKLMSGDAADEKSRADIAKRIDADIDTLDATIKLLGKPDVSAEWDKLVGAWHTLRGRVNAGSIDASRSFDLHTGIVHSVLQFNSVLLDQYGLSLDSNLDSFALAQATFVDLPSLSEDFNRLRATGTIVLTRKASTPVENFTLLSASDRANERLIALKGDFAKVGSANASLAQGIAGQSTALVQSTQDMLATTKDKIIKATSIDADAHDYAASVSRVINAQYAMIDASLGALDGLLDHQADTLRKQQLGLLAGLLVCLGIATAVAVSVIRSITGPIGEAVAVAERVASGDLTGTIDVQGNNETAQLLRALNAMNGDLRTLVSNVRGSANSIADAASEIAAGNANLSERTEEQAASLEETASSLEELTSTVRHNSESAREASSLSERASDVAARGGAAVNSVVSTMREIAESAARIGEITSVIDSIAFQTNILALNAAVEAARASEHGRGFAVVAAEVRALAQRSANAAKEIKALIQDSSARIAEGARQAGEAGTTVGDAVTEISRLTGIMNEIAAASAEQTTGIEQVNVAVTRMDDVTQQNAALVEQASAATTSMADQARKLREGVSVFRVEADDQAQAGRVSRGRGARDQHGLGGMSDDVALA